MSRLHHLIIAVALCISFTQAWFHSENTKTTGPCQKECKYYGEFNHTFSCNNAQCTSIPDINKDAYAVFLQLNNITNITKLDLPQVTDIDLSDNSITTITPQAFETCANLERLLLPGNFLQDLNEENFIGSATLNTLDLSYNLIQELPDRWYNKDWASTLEYLFLQHNYINKIDEGTFTWLGRLKRLNLAVNKIPSIEPSHFSTLYAMEDLDLSSNLIHTIKDKTFERLDHLEDLDLSYNMISTIEENAFMGLDKLDTLVLTGNQISHFKPRTFEPLMTLIDLHLDFNPISSIEPGLFPPTIEWLSMSRMPYLTQIESKTFATTINLQRVHMSNNTQLTKIASDAFGGNSSFVKELILNNNSLTTLSPDLLNWDKVQTLELRGNKWHCDCSLRWILDVNVPIRSKDEIICATPEYAMGLNIMEVATPGFLCTKLISNRQRFRLGMLAVFTFGFIFLLGMFLYKCRHRMFPCWYGKHGKYFALYNVSDVDDTSIHIKNGYASHGGIVKQRNSLPAPVAV